MANSTSSAIDRGDAVMRAGFIQFSPVLGSPDTNMAMLEPLIRMGKDADLLVIPELANSGYNFESPEQAVKTAEEIDTSKFVAFLIAQSREHDIHLVAGMNEREGDKLFNTAILTGPDGLIGKYRKIHLFWNEPDFFEKGNVGLPVFDIGIARIGLLVCFDWMFPEAWRILALKGADVIAHPSNLVLPFAQQAVPVHGLVNKTFAITANRYGTEGNLTFSGNSFISDPLGQTLCNAPATGDEVRVLELDLTLARNKMITPRNHALKDRSAEDYGLLVT
jgi:predicted amidohydrolase